VIHQSQCSTTTLSDVRAWRQYHFLFLFQSHHHRTNMLSSYLACN